MYYTIDQLSDKKNVGVLNYSILSIEKHSLLSFIFLYNFISGTPPEFTETVYTASLVLLPTKSREKYNCAYNRFMEYSNDRNAYSFFVLMAYFK